MPQSTLPTSSPTLKIPSDQLNIPTAKPKRSVWAMGAIWAAVITVLAAIGTILRFFGSSFNSQLEFTARLQDLILHLGIGAVANYFLWWLIMTAIIAIWRKAGETSWVRPVLFTIFFLLVIAGVIVYRLVVIENILSFLGPPPTLAAIPTSPPTLAAIPISLPTPALTPSVLYSDDFSNSQSGWAASNNPLATFQYSGGQFVMDLAASNFFTLTCANRNFSDAVLRVDAIYVTGNSKTNGPMVIWRYVDSDNFYALSFNGLNTFSVSKRFKGQLFSFSPVIDPSSRPINRQGEINNITISFRGINSTIYINGKFTTNIIDSTFTSGDVCLGVRSDESSDVEVSYDNLVVYSADNWTPPK